jgi:hypothetical protein
MRLYGWCTRCKKIKPVRVTSIGSNLAVGICADCERERRKRKEVRR